MSTLVKVVPIIMYTLYPDTVYNTMACVACVHCTLQAGKNPLRRPPPYPEFHVQDYLEGVEERYKLSIPIDYERSIKCGVNDRYQPVCCFAYLIRARERITFKLCLLVYKAINGLAPSYLQDLCVPVTTVSTRAALRSAARGDLVFPRTRRRLGNRAFCVAGPTAWNSLSSDIRTASSVTTFKNLLKTHLFI